MSKIHRFEEIHSWQLARELNRKLGEVIDSGRFKHSYRLIDQIEGSAGSIMDNIAEGFERGGNKEFIQFLYIAKSSCGELRSQLYRASDRSYITKEEFDQFSQEAVNISNVLFKLIDYLQASVYKGQKNKAVDGGGPTTN